MRLIGERNLHNIKVARLYCLFAYTVALLGAWLVLRMTGNWHPLLGVGAADAVATCIVFFFSVLANNSSIYDPYWSVAPVPIALYFMGLSGGLSFAGLIVFILVAAWAVRLTLNWGKHWGGFGHEDWRYQDFRAKCGRWYWVVSFLGIHMFPTICVYLGCISLYPALVTGTNDPGLLHVLAAIVTGGAIAIETIADLQLKRFIATRKNPGETLVSGIWGISRHPNYLGEILFWWGLFLFALASGSSILPVVGPLVITGLFVFVSVPMIDRRMLARHPEYGRIMQMIPALVPVKLGAGRRPGQPSVPPSVS